MPAIDVIGLPSGCLLICRWMQTRPPAATGNHQMTWCVPGAFACVVQNCRSSVRKKCLQRFLAFLGQGVACPGLYCLLPNTLHRYLICRHILVSLQVMSYDIQHIQNQMSPKEIRKLRLARKRDAAHRVKVCVNPRCRLLHLPFLCRSCCSQPCSLSYLLRSQCRHSDFFPPAKFVQLCVALMSALAITVLCFMNAGCN